ncbi:MAG: DUF1512 family protein [Promethearchaeia archaeon]
MYNFFQLGAQGGSDPFSIVLNLMFFLLIFISMFYGRKIQAWRAAKQIESGLEKLKNWDEEGKQILLTNFKKYANKKELDKDLMLKLEEFMRFVTISPVSLDPAGIVAKFDHIIDNRDSRFREKVLKLAPDANEVMTQDLENLVEAAMAVDYMYRLIKHYLILGKKSKSAILLMQISMQMPIILGLAKAYHYATKAFSEGSPIGDALGPMVAGQFIRDLKPDEEEYEGITIAKETIMHEMEFEDRTVFVVRAKGPGGTVGKPGKAIKKLIDQHGNSISRIIMIDAGLKLRGEKTGELTIGVGAAIGGVGVEKYFIEDSSTHKRIPIDALICKQSLEDAITTMKRPITQSVPGFVEKVKMAIRTRTEKDEKVIVAGIGNSIGIGI